jgi:hypothetical protein
LGHFKKAPWGLTHLLVTINKFTKWIEARPLAKIDSKQAGLKPRILTQEGEDVHARLSTRVEKWATVVPSVLWSPQITLIGQLTSHHFLWCMARWPCCPLNYSKGPLGSRPTNRSMPTKHDRLSSTCSKNQGASSSQCRLGTNKHSNDTTPGGFTPEPSW